MAVFEVVMPKLGESIIEATITKWLKQEGDQVEEDDAILEIATDKVDSEIPSPVEGKLAKLKFAEGDVVPVGAIIAIIDLDGEGEVETEESIKQEPNTESEAEPAVSMEQEETKVDYSSSDRFYSPLVKSISKKENISLDELEYNRQVVEKMAG